MPHILAVDDNRAICEVIRSIFEGSPYNVTALPDAQQARSFLGTQASEVSLVILDWELPGESGLDFLKFIKSRPGFKLLPVIMLTARTDPADVAAGIEAGALYYVTKPFDPRALKKLAETALQDFDAVHAKDQVIWPRGLCREAAFEFRTIQEADRIASFLAIHCPDPDAARLGLHELLINAVEHGNLGITHDEKSVLVQEGTLADEVKRRLAHPGFSGRRATVRMTVDEDSILFSIKDCGQGFDYSAFLSLSPERAFAQHGRGIAIAKNLCFDALEYKAPGNEVHARVTRKAG